MLSRFGGTAGRGAGARMVEQPQLTAVDVLKHHSAHLQRSANLLLAKEAAARQRLEAFALGRPLMARLGERHVELGAEQPLEQYQHRDIVARFGRFPHRNRILGRVSSAEEEAFLLEPGSSF